MRVLLAVAATLVLVLFVIVASVLFLAPEAPGVALVDMEVQDFTTYAEPVVAGLDVEAEVCSAEYECREDSTGHSPIGSRKHTDNVNKARRPADTPTSAGRTGRFSAGV